MDFGVGRRDGAPNATTAAAPAVQPASNATIVSNEIGAVTIRTNVRMSTRHHAARRQRRDTHGAAAVTTAVTAARPTAVATLFGSINVKDVFTRVTWASVSY